MTSRVDHQNGNYALSTPPKHSRMTQRTIIVTHEALTAYQRHHSGATRADVVQALNYARPVSHIESERLLERRVLSVRCRRLYVAPDAAGLFAVLETRGGGETVSAYVRFGEAKAERWKRANGIATASPVD